jgi:phage shock protein A
MSQIVTEVYDAFRAANVQEGLAKAAAGAIAGREDLVTKLDLERDVNRMQTEMGRVEADLKAAMADLKADMKVLKLGYGPAILGLLIKLVFFP